MKKNRLFVEVSASGHRIEYMQNLINHAHNKEADNLFFLLSQDFKDKLANLGTVKNVFYFANSHSSSNKFSKFTKYFFMYLYAIKLARKKEIYNVSFMFLNEFYLAAFLFTSNISISGIAFHTNYRKQSKLSFKAKIKEHLFFKFAKKSNVKKIFVLNDEECAISYNYICKKNVFSCLVDPVTSFVDTASYEYVQVLGRQYPDHKLNMLHAGVLSHRKGTDIFLNSLNMLPQDLRSVVRVFIVGRPVTDFSDRFDLLIQRVEPNIELIIIPDFVTNSELQAFIEFSDVAILPYRNTESSSGMISRSMLENKFIIAPNQGLVYNVLKNYRLYIPLLNNEPVMLAKAIEKFNKQSSSINEHKPTVSGFKSLDEYNAYKKQLEPSSFVSRLINDE